MGWVRVSQFLNQPFLSTVNLNSVHCIFRFFYFFINNNHSRHIEFKVSFVWQILCIIILSVSFKVLFTYLHICFPRLYSYKKQPSPLNQTMYSVLSSFYFQIASLSLPMLRSRLTLSSSVMMVSVNSAGIHGPRSCRSVAFVTSCMALSPALLECSRFVMHCKARRRNKWRYSTTGKRVRKMTVET